MGRLIRGLLISAGLVFPQLVWADEGFGNDGIDGMKFFGVMIPKWPIGFIV